METLRKSQKIKNDSRDIIHTPEQGTRIYTHADIVRMNMWISSNALKNATEVFKRATRIDEPRAKKGDGTVTDIKKDTICSIGAVKSVSTANVLRPNFRGHRKSHDTDASFDYRKFVDHIAFLCCRKDQSSEKEKNRGCLKEVLDE